MTDLSSTQLLDFFKAKQALLEGHFLLSSGFHSDRYFQSALLLQDTLIAERMGQLIAQKFEGDIDVVLSPAIGGLIIGHEVARAKKARFIFSEKDDEGKPTLRRGFHISEGESVLVVEDVITTGLSSVEVLKFAVEAKANLVGIGSIVLRSQKAFDALSKFQKPVESLLSFDVQKWEQSECPLCAKDLPIIKPGSRKQ